MITVTSGLATATSCVYSIVSIHYTIELDQKKKRSTLFLFYIHILDVSYACLCSVIAFEMCDVKWLAYVI